MAILVTGGLGVNGAPVLRKLLELDRKTIVIDSRDDVSLLDRKTRSGIELIQGDYTDRERITEILRRHQIETIVHMAAIVAEAQQMPLEAFRVNAYGTVQLLEMACAAGVRRFVFTSSRGVYGEQAGETTHPTYRPIREDDPLRPARVYDVCKVAAEGMGRNYAATQPIEFVALRFATIFGPGKTLRHKNYGVLSRLIEDGLGNRPVHIAQGGDQKDDIIYVEDAAEAIATVVMHAKLQYDTYNISHGIGVTLHDLAAAIRAVNPRADITIGPGLNYMGWEVNYSGVLDNQRATQDLGYRPRFSLKDAVIDYKNKLVSGGGRA
jgi:UDP-glucose 4-epimerase